MDALAAGAEFYRRAAELEQSLPDGVFRLLKFGKFQSGTVRNALSAHTHLEVAAGAEFYRRAAELEQSLPDGVFRLLKFGKFQSGTVRNALSAHTHLEGSLRAFQDSVFDGLCQGLDVIARETEKAYGCRVEIHRNEGYPAVMNPEGLYRQVLAALPFRQLELPSMTAEDFSWYQKNLPGLFFFLGLGDVPALHTDTFDFDDAILTKGADFFEKLANLPL